MIPLLSHRSRVAIGVGMVSGMTMLHAFDLLAQPPARQPDVVAVFGTDVTLRAWVLHQVTVEGDVMQVEGDATQWSDLKDELSTASLFDFGEGKRTIVVRDADQFLSKHRPEIEGYVAKPGTASRFVLELDSLASNTRLYKALHKDQMLVACHGGVDGKRGVTHAMRQKFLCGHLAARHDTKLTKGAADALVELLGEEIGMIDTEVAKLALYLEPGGTIDEPLVREVVAGWQGKTVWEINEAIAAGDASEALRQLDKLMSGGQPPIALLPQIAWSLRRLGMATAVVEHWERMGRKFRLEDALATAGFRSKETQEAKAHLLGIGRERARQLLPWLLDADLRLKGTHSADGRDRFLLEQLVVKLAKAPT